MSLSSRLISAAVQVFEGARPVTNGRVEVCVPAPPRSRSAGWRSWLRRRGPDGGSSDAVSTRSGDEGDGRSDRRLAVLLAARREFVAALGDVDAAAGARLRERIHAARSLWELWHLRPDVFDAVARCHAQAEADRRLAQLNRHFPTRSPRSGFGTLS